MSVMVLSRTRSVPGVVACLMVCGAVQAAPPAAQSPFGEVIEVNVVNVDVHVTDRDGRPVPGLQRDDFEVYEDGKRVKVTNFEAITVNTEAAAIRKASPAPSPAVPEPAKPEVAPEDRLHLVIY